MDDKSDFNWVNFSRKKSDMGGFVQSLITKIKGRRMKIRYLRCDNAGEHKEVEKICEKEGITMEYTAPYTPQQNGRVERKLNVI